MGMAASQARLLSITARIHDVEYQAQQIQSRKLQLATLEDEAYRKYNDALDATTLTFTNDAGTLIPATFNNLCGKSSIDNGMSKYYVFRTGDTDQLIVPDDIFEGYKKYGEDDPYVFAMCMMGADSIKLEEAEQKYVHEKLQSDDDGKAPLRDIVKKIAAITGDDPDKAAKLVVDGNSSIDEFVEGMDTNDPDYPSLKELVKEYHETEKEYRNKLYQHGGGEHIYQLAMGDDNIEFNNSEFQYYLRWGMLIEQEGGEEYCVQESEYGDGFGKDQEMLNGMLESGRMTVDTVEIDRGTGKIKDSATTIAGESRLAKTNTSTIDKSALAKAEAEYEFTMKQLDRKDKRYDMDLNKLETERTALTTEYDSVKKVIEDNIDRTFKIFS